MSKYQKIRDNASIASYTVLLIFYTMFIYMLYNINYITHHQLIFNTIYTFLPYTVVFILFLCNFKKNVYLRYYLTIGFLTSFTLIILDLSILPIVFFSICFGLIILMYHERYLQLLYTLFIIVCTLLANYLIFFFDFLSKNDLMITFLGIALITVSEVIIDFICQNLKYDDDVINNLGDYILRDQLTGAFNRNFIVDNVIFDINNSKNGVQVAFIDIDDFKYINDNYGHDYGDMVLKKFASVIMKKIASEKDTYLIRMGGDEFMIISMGKDYNSFVKLVSGIKDKIVKTTFSKNKINIYIRISVGITSTEECGSKNFDILYKKADDRLYEAKRSGKNQVIYQ